MNTNRLDKLITTRDLAIVRHSAASPECKRKKPEFVSVHQTEEGRSVEYRCSECGYDEEINVRETE